MNETRFDDPARWWFLTKDGFSKFARNPVAQGYEVLSRHQDFPHLRTKTEDGEQIKPEDGWPVTCLEYGSSHLPRPTWEQLDAIARQSFLSDYKFELHRMGLMEIAWLGPKAITFNCTEGIDSILEGAHCWLAALGLFRRDPAGKDRHHTRWPTKSPDQPDAPLTFSTRPRGNSDMVTISWGKLIAARKGHWEHGFSDHVVSALQTFLEHDPNYRAYRGARLVARSRHCDTLKKRITDLKKEETQLLALKGKAKRAKKPTDNLDDELNEIRRFIQAHENSLRHLRRRLKKTKPEIVALGCAASDCLQAGLVFLTVIKNTHLQAIGRKTSGDPRNHWRRLRKLQEQAGCFLKNRQAKGRVRRVSRTTEPINVVGTLFPSFKAKN